MTTLELYPVNLLRDSSGDTLVYVDALLAPRPPLRIASSVLLGTGSSVLRQFLNPTYQYRILRRKKLLQNGLPLGVKFVLDLSPPQEGEAAIEVMEKLWCPDEVLRWRPNCQQGLNRRYLEEDTGTFAAARHGERQKQKFSNELDEFYDRNWGSGREKQQVVESLEASGYVPDVDTGLLGPKQEWENILDQETGKIMEQLLTEWRATQKRSYGPGFRTPTSAEVEEMVRKSYEQAQLMCFKPEGFVEERDTRDRYPKKFEKPANVPESNKNSARAENIVMPVIPEYSVPRHIGAVERVLGILIGVDPYLHSPTMWYTVYKVAVMLDCAPLVVDYIVSWLYAGNQAFVELFTPLCMQIAEDVKSECLFRECFALAVARTLHVDGSFYCVERKAYAKWRAAIDKAASSLDNRLVAFWNEIHAGEWTQNPEIIPSLSVLNLIIENADGRYPRSFVHETEVLKKTLHEEIMQKLLWIREGNGQYPNAPPSVPDGVSTKDWNEWRETVYRGDTTMGRVYNRYTWMQTRDVDFKESIQEALYPFRLWIQSFKTQIHKHDLPCRLRGRTFQTPTTVQAGRKGKEKEKDIKVDETKFHPDHEKDKEDMDTDIVQQDDPPPPYTAATNNSAGLLPTKLPDAVKDWLCSVWVNSTPQAGSQIISASQTISSSGGNSPTYSPASPRAGGADLFFVLDDDTIGQQNSTDSSQATRILPPTPESPEIIRLLELLPLPKTLLRTDIEPVYRGAGGRCETALSRNPNPKILMSHPDRPAEFFPPDELLANDLLLQLIVACHLGLVEFPHDVPLPPLVRIQCTSPPQVASWQLKDILYEAQEYLTDKASKMCENALGWEFMDFQLLTCLTADEWRYLPGWAGGEDAQTLTMRVAATRPGPSEMDAGGGNVSVVGSAGDTVWVPSDSTSEAWTVVGDGASVISGTDDDVGDEEDGDEEMVEESGDEEADGGWEEEMMF